MTIRQRLRKLEETLNPPPRQPRLCWVAVADDGRAVCQLFYDGGTKVKPEGRAVGDLPREGTCKVYSGFDPDGV
jgi:hypothetical protein